MGVRFSVFVMLLVNPIIEVYRVMVRITSSEVCGCAEVVMCVVVQIAEVNRFLYMYERVLKYVGVRFADHAWLLWLHSEKPQ